MSKHIPVHYYIEVKPNMVVQTNTEYELTNSGGKLYLVEVI